MSDSLVHFPIYIGDYFKDTMSFTQSERGAFVDLCVAYIESNGRLKNDETLFIITRCFSEENRTSVSTVVERAFEVREGYIYSDKLNALINKQKKLRDQRTSAGKKSAEKRAQRQRALQQSESESDNKKNKQKKFEIPDWLPEQEWNDWLEMRRKNKKNATELAKQRALKKLAEFRDQGQDIAKVIIQSTDKCYTDFYEVKGKQGNENQNRPPGEWLLEARNNPNFKPTLKQQEWIDDYQFGKSKQRGARS